MSRPDPTGRFENTQSNDSGQLSGADPKNILEQFEAFASGSSVFLQVKNGVNTGQYVNLDKDGWAFIVPAAMTKYVFVPYGDTYYVVVADGPYKTYYLSYNRNFYVGAYRAWSNACYWDVEPLDCKPYPGLYPYDKSGVRYLCCNGMKDSKDQVIKILGA